MWVAVDCGVRHMSQKHHAYQDNRLHLEICAEAGDFIRAENRTTYFAIFSSVLCCICTEVNLALLCRRNKSRDQGSEMLYVTAAPDATIESVVSGLISTSVLT